MSILTLFSQEKIVGVVRPKTFEEGQAQFLALKEAGIKIIEISANNRFHLQLLNWSLKESPELLIGTASVLTLETAVSAKEAGAQFLVSPIGNPQIMDFAERTKTFLIPGAATPTEIAQIINSYSFPIVKLFPVACPIVFEGIAKVFPNTNFLLSSFPVAEFERFLSLGAKYFAIGSHLTENLNLTKQRFESLKAKLPAEPQATIC